MNQLGIIKKNQNSSKQKHALTWSDTLGAPANGWTVKPRSRGLFICVCVFLLLFTLRRTKSHSKTVVWCLIILLRFFLLLILFAVVVVVVDSPCLEFVYL